MREGRVDFYIGPDAGTKLGPELTKTHVFGNRRTILCRSGHPLAGAKSLRDLSGADWITTSITADAEDEIGALFDLHGLPRPKLTVRSQSALTLMMCLSSTDLLAMVPVQWSDFVQTWTSLATLDVTEELAAPPIVVVTRSDLPLTPAATYLLDLMLRASARARATVAS